VNNTKKIRLIIVLFAIAFAISSIVQAAEKNVPSGKQILIAQAKRVKGGPPGGKKGGSPGGKGGLPGGKPGGPSGGPMGFRPAESRKQIYDRKKVFLRLDINGDDSISAQEYDGPPKMFKELDTDNDGNLSFKESKWMLTFSPIPSGNFMMGYDTGKDDAKPVHKVNMDAFQMSTTEVTTAQYCQYLNAALKEGVIKLKLDEKPVGRIHYPISHWAVYGAPGTKYEEKLYANLSPVSGLSHVRAQGTRLLIPEHPLNQSWIEYVPDMKRFYVRPGFEDWPAAFVKWYGAYAFAEYYGLSLPTEAEWEYAASGGKQFKWATSDGTIGCHVANFKCVNWRQDKDFTGKDTPDEYVGFRMKVGSYPPNPFGLFDLGGNVWEWCLDWYKVDFYQYCVDNRITSNPVYLVGVEPPSDGSAKGGPRGGFSHDTRITRGGSYQYHQGTIETAYRNSSYPFRGNDHWGARVVLRPSSVVFNGKD